MITAPHYETRYIEPEVYVAEMFVDDYEMSRGHLDVLEMAKDRVRSMLSNEIHNKVEPDRDLLVRMEVVTEYSPEYLAHRVRGRLKVMDSPCELKPVRQMLLPPPRITAPEIVEVEKPAEEMPTGTLVAGLASKFWGHLKSMTQELEYDGPQG